MEKALGSFEKYAIYALTGLMMLVVLLSILELAWTLLQDIISPPVVFLEIDELLDIFGLFLLVLIGIELLETLKAYLKDNVVHVEVMLIVALIAIARKVIILDLSKLDGPTLIGIGLIVVALSLGYVLVRRGGTDICAKPTKD